MQSKSIIVKKAKKTFGFTIDIHNRLVYNIRRKGRKVKMKRRNLFLSLISSVLVAVAIVTFTIVSVVKPKNNKNNGGSNVDVVSDSTDYAYMNEHERDGSAELPYIIYSTDSYNDLLTRFGTEEKHFEFANDVDFAGLEYVTLFNNGTAFNGHIDGKGYSLKNIVINVTTDNLVEKFAYSVGGYRYAHIAIFGEMNGASIANLNITGLRVNVEDAVYNYIANGKYPIAGGAFKEIVVGGIAGVATNSTIENVTLNAEVAGSSYATSNRNTIGGVAGEANNLTVKDSKVNVAIEANAGYDYMVGGIAGYGRVTTVKGVEINVTVRANANANGEYPVTIGGLFGFAHTLTAEDVEINLAIAERNEAGRAAFVNGLTAPIDSDYLVNAAGVVAYLRADNSTQKTVLKNINVNSNVDFDCVFAGAIVEIWSASKTTTALVTITDVVVSSEVNALAVHGFARQIVAATISYTKQATNIKMTGSVKLNSYNVGSTEFAAATLISGTSNKYFNADYKEFFFEVSTAIYNKLPMINKMSVEANAFGGFEQV